MIYLTNILPTHQSKSILLDKETTKLLIQKAQEGCNESREKLIESNIRLVFNIVHRFKGKERIFEDLFQIGSIGLMKAIDKFDLSKGVQFSTYAVPLIIGEIKRYLRDNQNIRVSRSIKDNARKIGTFKENFVQKEGRDPRLSEVVEGTGLDPDDVILAIGSLESMLSLTHTAKSSKEETDLTLQDRLADKTNNVERWFENHCVKESFQVLNEKEKAIVQLRYFEDKTQSQVGEELGVSQAHVSRIEKSALKKLRNVI